MEPFFDVNASCVGSVEPCRSCESSYETFVSASDVHFVPMVEESRAPAPASSKFDTNTSGTQASQTCRPVSNRLIGAAVPLNGCETVRSVAAAAAGPASAESMPITRITAHAVRVGR